MPNGVTASYPKQVPNPEPSQRGEVKGWTVQTCGRMKRWFYSVDGEALDGQGVAGTLTVLDLPPSAEDWTGTHRRFLRRLRYDGLIRGQWLTEWQKRGVPHLHGCFFFPIGTENPQQLVLEHWLEVARDWRAAPKGQHVKDLYGLPGWLQYQAKHSARGVRHYQRANAPEAWQKRTGRLWGHVGDWPTKELVLSIDKVTFWRLRRNLRSWLISQARSDEDYRRLSWLRRMLQDPDKKRSPIRGMGEFCPEAVTRQLLIAALHDNSSGSVEAEPPQGGA
jgi:hypothetical protein